MEELTPDLFRPIIDSAPSLMLGRELAAAISNRSTPERQRLTDYHHLSFIAPKRWLEVTEPLLSDSTASDGFKKLLLMFLSEKCSRCDAQSDFPLASRLRISSALQELPPRLGRHYTPLKIRAYLGDDTVLSELNDLKDYEQITIASMLRSPKAVEFLKARFATSTDEFWRMEIAKHLGCAGDVTGVALLQEGLLDVGFASYHFEYAYSLAVLGEPLGMMYLLPLLEADEEDARRNMHLTCEFRGNRNFADTRTENWRLKLIAQFREKIRAAHHFASFTVVPEQTSADRFQKIIDSELRKCIVVAATIEDSTEVVVAELLRLDFARQQESDSHGSSEHEPASFRLETNAANWSIEGTNSVSSGIDALPELETVLESILGKTVESFELSDLGTLTLRVSESHVLRIEPWQIEFVQPIVWSLKLPTGKIHAVLNQGRFLVTDQDVSEYRIDRSKVDRNQTESSNLDDA